MKLIDNYFKIVGKSNEGASYKYDISLIAGHVVYEGHFPGNAVSPGVFSIEMMRECCEDALGKKLIIESINQCRFLSVLRPKDDEVLELSFTVDEKSEGEYLIVGQIKTAEVTYVTIKETLRV